MEKKEKKCFIYMKSFVNFNLFSSTQMDLNFLPRPPFADCLTSGPFCTLKNIFYLLSLHAEAGLLLFALQIELIRKMRVTARLASLPNAALARRVHS
jgi:hypothetical protein